MAGQEQPAGQTPSPPPSGSQSQTKTTDEPLVGATISQSNPSLTKADPSKRAPTSGSETPPEMQGSVKDGFWAGVGVESSPAPQADHTSKAQVSSRKKTVDRVVPGSAFDPVKWPYLISRIDNATVLTLNIKSYLLSS